MKKFLALGAVSLLLVAIVAGCGSSSSSTSSTTTAADKASTAESGSGGSSVVKEANENIAALTQEPPEIQVPPMKKAPPTGIDLTFAGCPLPVCVAVEEGVEQAAQAIGWNLKTVNQGLAPDTVESAWNGIAQNPGNAVIATSMMPDESLSKQLEKVTAAGVPYVATAAGEPTGKWMKGELAAPNQVEGDGELMADWVLADSGGEPGEVIDVWDPSLHALLPVHEGFHKAMEELCPECKVTDLKVSTADTGTKIPEEVVNELRTHQAAYVVFNLGDYATGVPQAMKAANLSSTPKLVARAASTTNMEQIKNGEMATALTTETVESGWRAVDLIARLLNKEELYEEGMPINARTFLTAENLPENISVPFTVPGFEKVFEKAWGK
jgi:ABC-type sugar transport system substrate-binding protein